MDYERAYKDALEKARFLLQQAVAGGNPIMANRYEQIFPELAESEDEKTAREIKEFILYKAGHLLDEDTEHRFVEYLERQKEKKKPNIELIQKSWYMEGYHDREFNREPKWIIKTGEEGPRYEENPKYGKPLPKEQKPGTTEDNPIDPFDTKLFQDGVKEGRRLEREDMQKEPFSCGHENGGDSEKQEHPSLPDNLDEAAFEYENTLWEDGHNEYGYCPQDIYDAFKAGAELMAKQGVTVNGYITDEIAYSGVAVILDNEVQFKPGEEVIVQIRKK